VTPATVCSPSLRVKRSENVPLPPAWPLDIPASSVGANLGAQRWSTAKAPPTASAVPAASAGAVALHGVNSPDQP
jgi:hypothetical protein